MKIPANWPFAIPKTSFYYGWVICALSTLGVLFSIPGQTMGMAVFTDYLIEALGLTRTQLSMAYLGGTVTSALFLTRAGKLYDRLGGRIMITLSSFLLGLMVCLISVSDILQQLIAAVFDQSSLSLAIPFSLIFFGYFGVRFFGQGVLTSCSQNVLLNWFQERRGLVVGIRGLFISFGFSIAPLFIAFLIVQFDWRGALWIMAALVSFGFAPLAFLLIRDTPATIGLQVDGKSPAIASLDNKTQNETSTLGRSESQSLHYAKTDPVFWLYSLSLAMHALFSTALTFHIVSIFNQASRSSSDAFAYFLPAAICSTATNLIASSIIDKYSLKPFLIAMLSLFIVGAVGLLQLDTQLGYWLLVVGFGSGGGLWALLSNLIYIRFYGPLNLGAISGFSTSITVFASAIGPAAFSLCLDWQGDYQGAIHICIALLALLSITAITLKQKELSL